jgi:hypothetical protein
MSFRCRVGGPRGLPLSQASSAGHCALGFRCRVGETHEAAPGSKHRLADVAHGRRGGVRCRVGETREAAPVPKTRARTCPAMPTRLGAPPCPLGYHSRGDRLFEIERCAPGSRMRAPDFRMRAPGSRNAVTLARECAPQLQSRDPLRGSMPGNRGLTSGSRGIDIAQQGIRLQHLGIDVETAGVGAAGGLTSAAGDRHRAAGDSAATPGDPHHGTFTNDFSTRYAAARCSIVVMLSVHGQPRPPLGAPTEHRSAFPERSPRMAPDRTEPRRRPA